MRNPFRLLLQLLLILLLSLTAMAVAGISAAEEKTDPPKKQETEKKSKEDSRKNEKKQDSSKGSEETEQDSTVVEVGPQQTPSNYDKKKAEADKKADAAEEAEEDSEARHQRLKKEREKAATEATKSISPDAARAGPNTAEAPAVSFDRSHAEEVGPVQTEKSASSSKTEGHGLPAGLVAEEGPGGPSPEHSEDLLPGIAEGQPGFIPDVKPQELLTQPGPPAQIQDFESVLGPSNLPTQSVSQIITRQNMSPDIDLPENFARIVVPTGTITGSTGSKQFHIDGGLKIYYNKVIIAGNTADIDEKNEVAVIYGGVTITDPQYTLSTEELRIYFNDKRFEAVGFVQFNKSAKPGQDKPNLALEKKQRLREYFAGQNFELYCKKLFYNWESKEMSALESVRLVHPSFNGTMERMDYGDKDKVYEMSGTVILEVTDYDWIFSNQLADAKDEKKIRAITSDPTKISCERMQYSEDTGIAKFFSAVGSVVTFDQTKRKITAAFMEVNDKTKDFYAEGTSDQKARYEQTDGQWLFDAEVISRQDTSSDLQKAMEGTLTADARTITFNYDRKRVEMREGVSVISSSQSIAADEMIQDETAKFFLLHGNVLVKPDAENELRAAQIYVDTQNDVFTFVGLVQGKLKNDQIPSLVPEAAEGITPGGVTGAPGAAPAAGLFTAPGTGTQVGPGTGRGTSKSKPEDEEDGANVAEKDKQK